MSDDLQRRVARVIVRAQHPGIAETTVDRLVNDLGVGLPLARLIVNELDGPDDRCPSYDQVRSLRCRRPRGHDLPHCEHTEPVHGSAVWIDPPAGPSPDLGRVASLLAEALDVLEAAR